MHVGFIYNKVIREHEMLAVFATPSDRRTHNCWTWLFNHICQCACPSSTHFIGNPLLSTQHPNWQFWCILPIHYTAPHHFLPKFAPFLEGDLDPVKTHHSFLGPTKPTPNGISVKSAFFQNWQLLATDRQTDRLINCDTTGNNRPLTLTQSHHHHHHHHQYF